MSAVEDKKRRHEDDSENGVSAKEAKLENGTALAAGEKNATLKEKKIVEQEHDDDGDDAEGEEGNEESSGEEGDSVGDEEDAGSDDDEGSVGSEEGSSEGEPDGEGDEGESEGEE